MARILLLICTWVVTSCTGAIQGRSHHIVYIRMTWQLSALPKRSRNKLIYQNGGGPSHLEL